ncbi:MAG: hypothetical protein ACPG6V_10045 [Flavobacteriales bacterium]
MKFNLMVVFFLFQYFCIEQVDQKILGNWRLLEIFDGEQNHVLDSVFFKVTFKSDAIEYGYKTKTSSFDCGARIEELDKGIISTSVTACSKFFWFPILPSRNKGKVFDGSYQIQEYGLEIVFRDYIYKLEKIRP